MSDTRDLYRHGDLLFRPASPERVQGGPLGEPNYRGFQEVAEIRRREGCIIQRGEATGHAHRFEGPDGAATILERWERRAWEKEPRLVGRYLEVKHTVILKHEEHGPLHLAPGLYEVVQAREFDYAAQASRRVVD